MRMTVTQCRDGFASARVARLATVNAAGEPHLVPVTFGVIDATPVPGDLAADDPAHQVAQLVVFAVDHKPKSTTALRRLDNIAANPRVAFLVDVYDDDWDRLWWVRADATAAIIDGTDRQRAIAALRAKYPQYERVVPQGAVVGALVSRWSGWRATPSGDGR
jgi:PPOX class probable F420-dependent enzyme